MQCLPPCSSSQFSLVAMLGMRVIISRLPSRQHLARFERSPGGKGFFRHKPTHKASPSNRIDATSCQAPNSRKHCMKQQCAPFAPSQHPGWSTPWHKHAVSTALSKATKALGNTATLNGSNYRITMPKRKRLQHTQTQHEAQTHGTLNAKQGTESIGITLENHIRTD